MKTNARQWLFLAVFFCLCGTFPIQSPAEVNVNIGVFAPPPRLAMASPPVMAVIPETTYVYFAPGVSVELFFFGGYWYRPHEGHWFRARSYRGPWNYIERNAVPPVFATLPRDYRNVPPGRQKIPYGQLKKNWQRWEKERHWDKEGRGRDSHGEAHERSQIAQRNGERHNNGNGKGKH